nr:hypothetical protein [Tanacetum cinerariifolium]
MHVCSIEEIVEDNEVKEATGKEVVNGNVVENETQASSSKVAPLFEGCNAEDGVLLDSVDEFPAAFKEKVSQASEAEAANGGAESDIHHEEDEIPPTELEVDMNDFHFEVDANIDHVRRQACNMGEDCGVDAIDFDDFNRSEDGGVDQIVTNRNKSLKQIRREYNGKCDIREGISKAGRNGAQLIETNTTHRALVYKLMDEDKARQKAIMELAVQFDNACTTKDDLRKAYEKCNGIPHESRALIDTFLKQESDKDYETNLAIVRCVEKSPQMAWCQSRVHGRRVRTAEDIE